MELTPREKDKLLLFTAALLAERRLARGVKLNYPEAVAYISAAILEGGGDIDFLIIGSTPMDNPALIFGNPRPSARVLKKGDIITAKCMGVDEKGRVKMSRRAVLRDEKAKAAESEGDQG